MNEPAQGVLAQLMGSLHDLESRLESTLEPLGLSLSKWKALNQLVAVEEPLPLGTLAERCACVRSNITQLVDRLEADKLVARSQDPRDRRSVRAELTPEGRQRHAEGLASLQQVEREFRAALTPEEMDGLLARLAVLRGLR